MLSKFSPSVHMDLSRWYSCELRYIFQQLFFLLLFKNKMCTQIKKTDTGPYSILKYGLQECRMHDITCDHLWPQWLLTNMYCCQPQIQCEVSTAKNLFMPLWPTIHCSSFRHTKAYHFHLILKHVLVSLSQTSVRVEKKKKKHPLCFVSFIFYS